MPKVSNEIFFNKQSAKRDNDIYSYYLTTVLLKRSIFCCTILTKENCLWHKDSLFSLIFFWRFWHFNNKALFVIYFSRFKIGHSTFYTNFK